MIAAAASVDKGKNENKDHQEEPSIPQSKSDLKTFKHETIELASRKGGNDNLTYEPDPDEDSESETTVL